MGEYADDQFRREVISAHGVDPGSMYGEDTPRSLLPRCPTCSKPFRSAQAIRDHLRDKHGIKGD